MVGGGEEDREAVLLEIAKSGDRSLLRRIVTIIPFCAYVATGIISILRMILVGITSKLPWSGLFRRATRTSARVLSVRVLRGEEKGILLLIAK